MSTTPPTPQAPAVPILKSGPTPPTPAPASSITSWLILGGVLLALLIGWGIKAAVTHSAAPVPGPSPKPEPGQLWQSLDSPQSNEVTGLSLPAPMEIGTTRKYVIITAKCDNDVSWLLTSQNSPPVEALRNDATNSLMIFTCGRTKDLITVIAYSSQNGKPTTPAITHVRITGDLPPPKPTPIPEPTPTPEPTPEPTPTPEPIKVSKVHVTFLLDPAKQTRAISDIVNSKALRDWLKANGHQVHELSIHDALPSNGKDPYGLLSFVKGKSPPMVVLQVQSDDPQLDGKVVDVQPLMSVQQVKDAVTKLTKAGE